MQWTEDDSSIQFEVVRPSVQLNLVERIVRLKALRLRTRCKVVGSNPQYQFGLEIEPLQQFL
jgi:hypothetical protein